MAGACLLLDEQSFHFVVETPHPNLVTGMKWLLGTYTMRFNRRHHFSGHLFGGRCKAQVIDETTPGYLRTAAVIVAGWTGSWANTELHKMTGVGGASLSDAWRANAKPTWRRAVS